MLTILKPKIINKVVAKFVIKNLPTIIGDPGYESLNEIIQALYANVATLPTSFSGGKNGHFGLVTKDTLYAIFFLVTPWKGPDDPGARPTIATNATVSHRQKANKTYSKSLQTF